MASHDVHVLAGTVGSTKRTKKINNMLNVLDKLVAEARESDNDNLEKIMVRSSSIAERMNWSQSTICRNGYPEFFTRHFESVEYRENKGVFIDIEQWVEERKDQRERLAEYKEKRGGE